VPRQRLSLKVRALGWLAQREHSRMELRRKLLRVARAEQAARAAALGDATAPSPAGCEAPETCVDALLDWLQAHGYLSEARFVDSRIHVRAARYGNRRIQLELAQHGLTLDAEARRELQASEQQRAQAVWLRKFGQPPVDAAERARQMRFLAQRGFSAEVVRRVVQGADDDLESQDTESPEL